MQGAVSGAETRRGPGQSHAGFGGPDGGLRVRRRWRRPQEEGLAGAARGSTRRRGPDLEDGVRRAGWGADTVVNF